MNEAPLSISLTFAVRLDSSLGYEALRHATRTGMPPKSSFDGFVYTRLQDEGAHPADARRSIPLVVG